MSKKPRLDYGQEMNHVCIMYSTNDAWILMVKNIVGLYKLPTNDNLPLFIKKGKDIVNNPYDVVVDEKMEHIKTHLESFCCIVYDIPFTLDNDKICSLEIGPSFEWISLINGQVKLSSVFFKEQVIISNALMFANRNNKLTFILACILRNFMFKVDIDNIGNVDSIDNL